MKEKKVYERPLTEVLDVFLERVLCQSPAAYEEEGDADDMTRQRGAW